MWNCPVCASDNRTMVCGCGFDNSRNYESFPTFGRLPAGIPSASGLTEDPEPRMAEVTCPDCGLKAVIHEDEFFPTCKKCGTTPLNPTDHVRIYRHPFRQLRSGKQEVNPYSLYKVLTDLKLLFPYADPETARDLTESISLLCDHPERIGLHYPDHVKPLLALVAGVFRRMLDRGEVGKNIFDEWEAANRERLEKQKQFVRSAGFRRDRKGWHFTPFDPEDYRRRGQDKLLLDASAAYEKGDYALARRLWESAADEGNPYAYAHLGMLDHYGCRGSEPDRVGALNYFHSGAVLGCPLAAAWLSEYYRMGYVLEMDERFAEKLYAAVDPELAKMCEAGDADARYFRGFGLMRGIGVPEDKAGGVRLLQQAHHQKHPKATVELAECYYYGDGVERDYDKAFRLLTERACPGSKKAPYLLGLCYYYGRGTEPAPGSAFRQFKRAAELGHGSAKDYLGDCYRDGTGTDMDLAEAARWYHDAADNHGNSCAAFSLGCLYSDGQGIAKDDAAAIRYWTIAAEDGNADAQKELGYAYLEGHGVATDRETGRAWLKKAARNNHTVAQFWLGYSYLTDSDESHHPEGIVLMTQSAEGGFSWAQYKLGHLYELGFRTAKDLSKALQWYREAARQDHPEALCALGRLYLDGKGTSRDPDAGIEYLQRSSDLGHRPASLELADRYYLGITDYRGTGLYTNPSLAHKYAMLAVEDKTDGRAQYRMGTIIHYSFGNPAGAKEWYRRAIQNGSAEARLELSKVLIAMQESLSEIWLLLQGLDEEAEVLYLRSVCLENGWGCPRDKRLAKETYNKAIEKGYVDTAKKKKWFGLF